MMVRLKQEKPHWGARKIRELLVRRMNGDVRVPATSTVHAVLDRHGLVKPARQRRRFTAEGTPLSLAIAPNDLWCADPRLRVRSRMIAQRVGWGRVVETFEPCSIVICDEGIEEGVTLSMACELVFAVVSGH